ncbi:hypothetical protein MJ923_01090 [Shewanella sp. 3B26]|uniref:Uncharacterized protein n=1 Tax=Shewanella zhuhaiensis TaxID=2919576 RepID=A0AAJ1EYE9_9GAMM|nr:hypothetical protein [Shewanella zhuhaiensis]MCH4292896.1 hypothetical protein [Shewanella zhuhaiensis]
MIEVLLADKRLIIKAKLKQLLNHGASHTGSAKQRTALRHTKQQYKNNNTKNNNVDQGRNATPLRRRSKDGFHSSNPLRFPSNLTLPAWVHFLTLAKV